jgi:hypothetical protein
MTAKIVRATLGKLMHATLVDEAARGDWTYRAVRPLYVPHMWTPGQHVTADCSKGVQYLVRWALGPDPMGSGFGPYGNSQTICFHLHHLDHPSELQVGDPVTFGSWGNEHAAMVLEPGSDPLLWSHGHQGAPNSYRLSWDTRAHQLLKLMPDDPKAPPTAVEKLQAKTGWFSWVAWKLGEGAWQHYGKANPKVRPDVPTVISPQWWARYAAFLKARNTGDRPTTAAVRAG